MTLPLKLHGYGATPNPIKVAILLEELHIPYEVVIVPLDKCKLEPFVSLNPNGRIPALEDPNTGITIFEVT
jgi:glutathione S-transferase